MGHRLRILHISDLHIRGDWEKEAWRRRRVLGDAWKRNLDDILKDGPVDLVAFTGDLAFSGRPVEYEEVGQFLDEVLSRLQCPRERLFVVPGNHDVDRSVASASWEELRGLLRPGDAQEFSQWMASPKESAPRGFRAAMRDDVLSRQAAYRDWVVKGLGRPGLLPSAGLHPRLGYRETLRLPGLPFAVHVIGLDSAWLAGDDNDSGRLWLTEDQVMRLATDEGRELSGIRLALIHHPLDQLMDGAHARRLLAGHVDVLLRGHLHETEAVLSEEPSSALRSLAAGCLYESDRYPNSFQLIQLTVDGQGRSEACEVWFRTWSARGHWHNDDGQYPGTRGGWLRWWGAAPSEPPVTYRGGVFVGRVEQLRKMEEALLPAVGAPRPVALQGMAGVGKSYLVGHFAREHAERFPGGFHRLVLQPGLPQGPEALLREMADRLGLSVGPGGLRTAVRERLRMSSTLLVIDNVDGPVEALAAAEVVRQLAGCAVVVSGRLQGLGETAGWTVLPLRPLEAALALGQLSKEYRAPRDSAETEVFAHLVRELGHLPLAIHLAAGYLRRGHTVDGFLTQLRRKGLAVGPPDRASELFSEGASRAVLRTSLELSLELLRKLLREEWGKDAPRFLDAMAALGHAPAAGVGRSLGAAVAGLSEDDFGSLVAQAVELSLLEKVPEEESPLQDTWRVHPLLAELLREGVAQGVAVGRMTEWFTRRLPAGAVGEEELQRRRWEELTREATSLAAWLPLVPTPATAQVVEAGVFYAQMNGPFLTWVTFLERVLPELTAPEERALALLLLSRVAKSVGMLDRALTAAGEMHTLGLRLRADDVTAAALTVVADVLQLQGHLDEALRIRREEVLPLYLRQGDVLSGAIILGQVADILFQRGELDEALRIRREEELPVYAQEGDVRAYALAQGQVADILHRRGELDEALRIRREEVLPALKRLGAVRELAVALGQVADILHRQGAVDEALRIRQEEVLPVLERLGDLRERAIILGRVADIQIERGELDAALSMLRQEVLPGFERVGDVRAHAVALGRVAEILQRRGNLDEALRIRRKDVLPVLKQVGDIRECAVVLGRVADIHGEKGELDEALRIRREEELPVYERLGAVRERARALGRVADILQQQGKLDEALHLLREEVLPVYERLGAVGERAFALGKVANILQRRGEHEEALRIIGEEVVPVLERSGDRRARAAALSFRRMLDLAEEANRKPPHDE